MTPDGATVVAGLVIPSTSPVFLAGVAVHVAAGLTAVLAGAGAMLSAKGRGRHSSFGTIYYWSLSVVVVTAALLSAVRWAEDSPLFVLAALSFAAASFGRMAMRRRWFRTAQAHLTGMGVSYIVLLTAFYVDNGPNLPIWKDLSPIAYWLAPTAVGLPIMIYTLLRHPLARRVKPPR